MNIELFVIADEVKRGGGVVLELKTDEVVYGADEASSSRVSGDQASPSIVVQKTQNALAARASPASTAHLHSHRH